MATCIFCKFESRNPGFAYCSMCGKLLPGHHQPVLIHKNEYDVLVAKALKSTHYETYGHAPHGKILVNFSDYEILKNNANQQLPMNKVSISKIEYEHLKEVQRKVRKYEIDGYAPQGKILVNENAYNFLKKQVEQKPVQNKPETFVAKIVKTIKNMFN